MDLNAYLTELASSDPTPGGGSAAAVAGALGAALVAMVARITVASPRRLAVHGAAEALIADADALRERFLVAREADEAAYGAVVRAQTLPRTNDAEQAARAAAVQAALAGAAAAPLAAAALAADLAALAVRAAGLGNDHLGSDVECAVRFARAAFDASVANVRVNHRYLADAATVAAQAERLAALAAALDRDEAATLARL